MEIVTVVEQVCGRNEWCDRQVLESALHLALEIAAEGREGAPVGTLFTIGRPQDVLATSRSLVLDPLSGHTPQATHLFDPRLRGTLKELAQLDGAFVIAEDGTVVAGCQYLDVSGTGVEIPMGLGSRHIAGAAISRHLGIVVVVVSASGVVRVFCRGELVAEIRDASNPRLPAPA